MATPATAVAVREECRMNPYPTLSGETLVVPILGDPIAQVRSPDGTTRTFADRGCNAVVVPLQVAPADFDALIAGVSRSSSVGGLIATVPHKFGLVAHLGLAHQVVVRHPHHPA